MVLAAEYDRARIRNFARTFLSKQHHHGSSDQTIQLIDIHKWSPNIVYTLHRLGFFTLLEIDNLVPSQHEFSSRILRFRSGNNVDAQSTAELISELDQLLSPLTTFNERGTIIHLQGRLIEAIQNVHDHAYPPNISWKTPPVYRWWITASVNVENNFLHIVVYDQGISIPMSIPHSPRQQEIMSLFRKMVGKEVNEIETENDGLAIQAAFEVGRSETGKRHRGRGLMFMRELVDLCTNGELCVLSRNGGYLYRKDGHEVAWSHENSIGGTLVEWQLQL